MGRHQKTDRDYLGNAIINAQLHPQASSPGAAVQAPYAPWIDTATNKICWYDTLGNMHCVVSELQPPLPKHLNAFISGGDPVPDSFHPALTHVFLDVDNMPADLDLTGWQPASSGDNLTIRVRKVDASPYKIIYTDTAGLSYKFANTKSEYIVLMWDAIAATVNVG